MMKKLFFITMVVAFSTTVFAQKQDKVLGTWLTQYGDSKVTIKKDTKGLYYGEVSWLKEPYKNGKPRVDEKNPDSKLKKRPIMGLRLLNGFKYDDGEWVDGTIYDPKEGKTYKCYMWFDDNNFSKLHVKGYIGFSFIGREVVWTRSN